MGSGLGSCSRTVVMNTAEAYKRPSILRLTPINMLKLKYSDMHVKVCSAHLAHAEPRDGEPRRGRRDVAPVIRRRRRRREMRRRDVMRGCDREEGGEGCSPVPAAGSSAGYRQRRGEGTCGRHYAGPSRDVTSRNLPAAGRSAACWPRGTDGPVGYCSGGVGGAEFGAVRFRPAARCIRVMRSRADS